MRTHPVGVLGAGLGDRPRPAVDVDVRVLLVGDRLLGLVGGGRVAAVLPHHLSFAAVFVRSNLKMKKNGKSLVYMWLDLESV